MAVNQYATPQHDAGQGVGGGRDAQEFLKNFRKKKQEKEEERKRQEKQEAAAKATPKPPAQGPLAIEDPEAAPEPSTWQPPTTPTYAAPVVDDDEPTIPKPRNIEPSVASPTLPPPDPREPPKATPSLWNDALGFQVLAEDPDPWRSNWETHLGTTESIRDRAQRWAMTVALPSPLRPFAERLIPSAVPPPSQQLAQNTAQVAVEDQSPDDPYGRVKEFLNPVTALDVAHRTMVPGGYMVPGFMKGFTESASWDTLADRRLSRLDKVQESRQSMMGLMDPNEVDNQTIRGKAYEIFATATESGIGRKIGVVGANMMFPLQIATEGITKFALGEMTRGQWGGLLASGEIPDIMDTPYHGRIGLIEPVVNTASALWRTIQPQIVGENAPEILRIPEERRIEQGWAPITIEVPVLGEVETVAWVGKVQEMTRQAQHQRTMLAQMEEEDPEMAERLSISLTNFVSDSTSVQKTMEDIYSKDIRIRQMENEMYQYMMMGDTVQAQTLQYHITQEKAKSDLDYLDANANPWAEFFFGLLDPTIIIGKMSMIAGATPEGVALTKAMREIDPRAIQQSLDTFDEVMDMADVVLAGMKSNKFYTMADEGLEETTSRGLFNFRHMFRRTPESQALNSTYQLHSTITNLTMHLSDPADIKKVILQLIEDPTSLAKGVTGIVSPTAEKIVGGRWYPGNWAFTNKAFRDNYPILKTAKEDILSLPEFRKDNPDKLKLMAELDGVLYQTGRRIYGDVDVPVVPVGTKSYDRVGNKFVFKDGKGNILSETEEFDAVDANTLARRIDEIKDASGQEQWGAGQLLVDMASMSRGWLSNQHLNLSPGAWVRNGLGFTANLVGDSNYSFKSMDEMVSDFNRIAGDISQDMRAGEAFGQNFDEVVSGSKGSYVGEARKRESFGWFGRLLDNISGLGPIGKAGGRIWTGTTEVPLGFGRSIKFGEGSGYTTALYSAFMRSLRESWKQLVGQEVITKAVNRGVDQHKANAFGDLLSNYWDQGRDAIRSHAMEQLKDNRLMFTLDPGIYGETLTPAQNKNVNDFMRKLIVEVDNPDEAEVAIRDFMMNMRVDAAKTATTFPKQPGTTLFFDRDIVNDGYELTDDIKESFENIGLRLPDGFETDTKLRVSNQMEGLKDSLAGFMDDVADVQADGSLDFMVSTMNDWTKARIRWLVAKDGIFKEAADQGTAAAWEKAHDDVIELWNGYIDEATEIVQNARETLVSPDGLPDVSSSVDKIMADIARFDDVQNEADRLLGVDIARISDDEPTFKKALEANREMLQYGMAQMLDAYRRYPSPEGFNALYDAMMRIDTNGAVIGQYIRKFGEMARANRIPMPVHLRNRSDIYNQMFTQQYEYFVGTGRSIIEMGITAKSSSSKADDIASIPDAVRRYFSQVEANKPAFTPSPGLVPGYVPTRDEFLEAGTRLKLPGTSGGDIAQAPSEMENLGRMAGLGKSMGTDAFKPGWHDSVTKTGRLPKEESGSLMEQIYENLVTGGASRNTDTVDRAAEIYERAGGDAKEASRIFRSEFASPQPGKAPPPAGVKPNNQTLLRNIINWADENVEGFSKGRRQGWTGLNANEKSIIFQKMTEQVNLGQVDLYGIGTNQRLADAISSQNKAMNALGGSKALDVADVFEATDQQYSRMTDDLIAMWKGDAAQHITARDAVIFKDILDEAMPYYDNAIGAAMSVGQHMGRFALLNFADRRNIDTMASVIFPFHYFWSRSPRNWGRRMLTRPAVANWWYESQRAIALENKQAGTEGTRWENSMPNPMAMVWKGAPARVGNIISYAMPNYGANPFKNPETANNRYEAAANGILQYSPGISPQMDMMMAAGMDVAYPLEDGTKRIDDFNFGDFVPWMRRGYYALSAERGEFMPLASKHLGDEWDAYRIGREISTQIDNPDPETQALHMLAGQVIANQQAGKDKWDGIPEGDREWIEENLPQFIRRANWDRFTALMSSGIVGVGSYHMRDDELQMREGKRMYAQGGWTPEQPGGSKAGMTGLLDKYPGNAVSWSLGALRPGYEGPSPAESAEETRAWAELEEAGNALSAKQSEILAENPTIHPDDMRALTKEESDRMDAAFANLPEMDAKSTRGMNPQEKAEYVIEAIYKDGKELYPDPSYPEGDAGTPEALSEYYEDKGVAEEQRLQMLKSRIDHIMQNEEFFSRYIAPQDQPWYNEMKAMLSGRTAEDWIDMYRGRYQTDEYFEWRQGYNIYNDAVSRTYDEADENFERLAPQMFSVEERALYDQYMAMPNETPEDAEARTEFAKDNQSIWHMRTLHYNPREYAEGVKMWGEDWYEKQANIPSKRAMFGTNDLLPDQQTQYYAALNTYTTQNPEANAVRLWYQGRPKPKEMQDAIKEGLDIKYIPNDWGRDYKEAVEIFGEEVFQYMANESAASLQGGSAWRSWVDSHWEEKEKILGYNQWYWDQSNDPKTIAEMTRFQIDAFKEQDMDEIIDAMEATRRDQTVLVEGPAGPTPSFWRGDATPAQFMQNYGTSIGAVPEEVYNVDDPMFVPGDVKPDPKEYVHPGVLEQTMPGMEVTTGESLTPSSQPSDYLDLTVPGMATFAALLVQEDRDILEANAKRPEPKTMEQLLQESDKYKELIGKKAKWAEWEARAYTQQSFAVNVFGADPKNWNAYFQLEKGSAARKAMRDADPTLDASLTFAYNQDKWPAAQEAGFTAEDVIQWARRPDYNETNNDRRTQFFTENPRAFQFNSWINGRYKPSDSDDPTYSRDWGVDYREAQERFGEDIWDKVVQYRALPKGTGARTQFREINPSYSKWEEWWYSRSSSNDYGYSNARYSSTRSSYSRSYGGGGGRSSGGYGSWSENHDVGFPDGGIYISPYRGMNIQPTPRFRSPFSQSADNWRRYMGNADGSRLLNWNTRLGG